MAAAAAAAGADGADGADAGGAEGAAARLGAAQLRALAGSAAVRERLRVRGVAQVLRHVDAQWARGPQDAEAALEAALKDHPAVRYASHRKREGRAVSSQTRGTVL